MLDTTAMSDAETAHASAPDTHDDRADGHGHAPAGEPLGPIDVTAWAYALVGAAMGTLVVLVLFIARGS